MDVEHEHAQARGLAHGPGHRVGDVVELQIEEHADVALARQLHRGGAGRGEELRADLAPGDHAREAVQQPRGLVDRVDVEGDEQAVGGVERHAGAPSRWYSCRLRTEGSLLSRASMAPMAAWMPSTVR